MANPEKIVVVRYRFIGDTLLTIPFLRALRSQNPNAIIHLLVGEDAYPLMRDCPYINEAIPFEPRKLGFWNAVKQLRQQGYGCAYLLKRSLSSALMMWLAGIPNRIGFNTENRGILLTQRVSYRDRERHEAECFLDLLPQGENSQDRLRVEAWIPPEAEAKVLPLLSAGVGPRIVLHATSTNSAKCWPIRHFQALAEMLVSSHKAQLYVLGTLGERRVYEDLIQSLSPEARKAMVNLCGKTTLVESLALLKHMDLVVANDSGMIHMAAAVDTPVVAIFGPMDPNQWRPLGDKATVITHPQLTCRPCRMKISCHHRYPCLTEITPQQVFDACKPYLKS